MFLPSRRVSIGSPNRCAIDVLVFLLSLSNANNVQLGCLEWSTCDNWLKFNPVYQFEGLKNQILKSSLCFAKVGEICMKFLQILAPNCASNCASPEVDSVNVNSARVFGLWVVRSNCNFVKLLIIASLRNEHLKQSIFTFFLFTLFSTRFRVNAHTHGHACRCTPACARPYVRANIKLKTMKMTTHVQCKK